MPPNEGVQRAFKLIEQNSVKILRLTVGKHVVDKPGHFIPKAEARGAPKDISFDAPNPSATYIAVGLDLDAPVPSLKTLSPLVHWIQPGFKAEQGEQGAVKLTSSEPVMVTYIDPGPPPMSGRHRYSFYLYEQPADFDAKKLLKKRHYTSILKRSRFSLDNLVKEGKLGELVAFTYFTCN